MIREVLRPQNRKITIKIPASYVGKKLEFILFPLEEDEKNEHKLKHSDQKSLKGVLNQYADNSKIALEDTAWQNRAIRKFKENASG